MSFDSDVENSLINYQSMTSLCEGREVLCWLVYRKPGPEITERSRIGARTARIDSMGLRQALDEDSGRPGLRER
jgi:hypothetical protein